MRCSPFWCSVWHHLFPSVSYFTVSVLSFMHAYSSCTERLSTSSWLWFCSTTRNLCRITASATPLLSVNSLPSRHTSSPVGLSANLPTSDNLHNYLAIVLLIWARCSDKLQIRSAFIYAGYFLLLIGYSINISNASNGAKYFGTFLIVIGSYGSLPGVVTWYVLVIPV